MLRLSNAQMDSIFVSANLLDWILFWGIGAIEAEYETICKYLPFHI